MKTFLFFVVTAILCWQVEANNQLDQELKLEREAEEYQRSITIDDKKAAEEMDKARNAARYKAYEACKKAAQDQGHHWIGGMTPPECTYYSTEGLYILPNTEIAPYPKIAHVNTELNFKFPKTLGGCTAQFVRVYNTKELGYSIKYANADADIYANVYIYDMPLSPLREDVVLVNELQRVAAAINEVKIYKNVFLDENISRGSFKSGEKIPYLYFYAQFDAPGFSRQNAVTRCYSYAMLFAKNRKFVKIRITQGRNDSDAFLKAVDDFVEAFDQKIILDSQTRKRKFEKHVSYPMFLPKQ